MDLKSRTIQDMLLNGIDVCHSTQVELNDFDRKTSLSLEYMKLKFYIELIENFKPAWKTKKWANNKTTILQFPFFQEGSIEGNPYWYDSEYSQYMYSIWIEKENDKYMVSLSNPNPSFRPPNSVKIPKRTIKDKEKTSLHIDKIKEACESWYTHYSNYFTQKKRIRLEKLERMLVKSGIDTDSLWDIHQFTLLHSSILRGESIDSSHY